MNLEKQSPDIAQGVHVERNEDDVGAGDQVPVLSMSYYQSFTFHSVKIKNQAVTQILLEIDF